MGAPICLEPDHKISIARGRAGLGGDPADRKAAQVGLRETRCMKGDGVAALAAQEGVPSPLCPTRS